MRERKAFFVGLVVGAAVGVTAMWALRMDPPPGTSSVDQASAPSADLDTAPVTLGAKGHKRAEPAASPPDAARRGASATAAAEPPPKSPEQVSYEKALAGVRAQLRQAQELEPGAAAIGELLKAFRTLMDSDNPRIARLGTRALIRLAGYGKLSDEKVGALAAEFRALEAGAAARPALAGAVALAWAHDKRLAGWLEVLPREKEPAVRATVVEALDESASAAYREYLLRLSRSEADPDVLEHAWHEDPITVAMTRDWAPRLILEVERRIEGGGLPPVVRGRGLFAIGLAAVHEAPAAAAAIGRLIATEAHAGVRDYGRAVLEAIEEEAANVQTLDRLWAEHRRSLDTK